MKYDQKLMCGVLDLRTILTLRALTSFRFCKTPVAHNTYFLFFFFFLSKVITSDTSVITSSNLLLYTKGI